MLTVVPLKRFRRASDGVCVVDERCKQRAMGVLIAVHVPPNLVNLLIPRHFKKHTGLVVFWAMLRRHCSDAEFVNLPDRPAIRLDRSAASLRLEAQLQTKN